MQRKSLGQITFTGNALRFGEAVGPCLSQILPQNVCVRAAATCRFEFRGIGANRNFGRTVHTDVATMGNVPLGCGAYAIQRKSKNCIQLTDDDAANVILGCFGLSVDDIYDHWGKPQDNERYIHSLQEIVETLAPQFLIDAA